MIIARKIFSRILGARAPPQMSPSSTPMEKWRRCPPGPCPSTVRRWRQYRKVSITTLRSSSGRNNTKYIYVYSVIIRPPGTTVPDGLMFYPWCFIFLFRHSFSEIPQPIALKLCHMIRIWLNFIIPLQKFGGRSLKKIWGQKHAKFRSILDHIRLWSRISPERLKIFKIGKQYELWQFLLRLMKKVRLGSTCEFGPKLFGTLYLGP